MALPSKPNEQKHNCGLLMIHNHGEPKVVLLEHHRDASEYYVRVVNTTDEKTVNERDLVPWDATTWDHLIAEYRLNMAKSRVQSAENDLRIAKEKLWHVAVQDGKTYMYNGQAVRKLKRWTKYRDGEQHWYEIEYIESGEKAHAYENELIEEGQ